MLVHRLVPRRQKDGAVSRGRQNRKEPPPLFVLASAAPTALAGTLGTVYILLLDDLDGTPGGFF